MIFKGYSKGKYSTWIYYAPYHTMFDAGEGLNTVLEEKIAAIGNVMITHGHSDHYAGLLNLVATKLAHHASGGDWRPLTIYFPRADNTLCAFIRFLRTQFRLDRRRDTPITWVDLGPGERVPLPTARETFVETYPVRHTQDVASLGYTIGEVRQKLRPEFEGKSQAEIRAAIVSGGKGSVTHPVDKRILTYVGDTLPLAPETFEGVDILLHEATYIYPEDREDQLHSTLGEAIATAREAKVGRLLLYHFSARYSGEEVRAGVRWYVDEGMLPMKYNYIVPGKVFEVES